jgi:hypothetical protein
VRDILSRLETEQRVTDANAKVLELNNTTLAKTLDANSKALDATARETKESISSVIKRQDLQQLQIAELKESILRLTLQGRK